MSTTNDPANDPAPGAAPLPDPPVPRSPERGHSAAPPHNRVGIALRHGWRYAFESQARLARDVGVSRSTISRLIAGKTAPSLKLAQTVAAALSVDLGVPLPLDELFSPDGSYPTPSGCAAFGCPGCFPEEAYDRKGNLLPAFRDQKPGDWTMALPKATPDCADRADSTDRASAPPAVTPTNNQPAEPV